MSSLMGPLLLITALTSLRTISGSFWAMSLSLLILWVLATGARVGFPFFSKSVEFGVGSSLTLQRRAGLFSLVLGARGHSQLRVMSLMAIHCSADSGPALYQLTPLPPLFMLAIIIILKF